MSRRFLSTLITCLAMLAIGLAACASPAATPTVVPTKAPAPTAAPAAPTTAPAATAAPAAVATKPAAVTTPAAAGSPTAAPTKPAVVATPTVPPKPVTRGKQIDAAVSTFGADLLDPVAVTIGATRGFLEPMFDSLIRVDTSGQLIPGVFTAWKASADGKYWDFTVRKGVKFHDGSEATAEDCKFTLDRYGAQDSVYRAQWGNIYTKSEVLDPYTLRVWTKLPDPFLPIELSQFGQGPSVFFMPKKYIEEKGVPFYRKTPMGSGPYQFKSFTAGSEIQFTAFDNHWEIKPGFDSLRVLLVPQEAARIGLLRSGGAQDVELSPDGTKDAKAAGMDIQAVPGSIQPQITFFGSYYPEAKGMAITDVRVRQALSLAINRQEIINALLPGGAIPNAPGLLVSSQDIDYAKWAKTSAQLYRYDPNEAKKLLAEAGFANGFEIMLYSYPLSGAPTGTLSEATAGFWEKVGVKVKLTPTDQGAFSTLRSPEPPPPGLLGQASLYRLLDRPDFISPFNSLYQSGGTLRLVNKAAKTSAFPEIEKLYADVGKEFDDAKRRQMFDDMVAKSIETYTCLPIADTPSFFGTDPKINLNLRPLSHLGATIVYAVPK